MRAESRSSFRPADSVLALVAAAGLFLAAWSLLHVGFWRHDQVIDTPVYARYGTAIAHGEVPYRDFVPEYPPLALPVMALPALVAHDPDGFRRAFEPLMAACGVALLGFVALAARRLDLGDGRIAASLAYVALFPLALGTVVLTRFDLWPAALTTAALAALLARRDRLGLGVLAAATAAKLYPGVLLPLAVAWVWRRRGRREALVCLAVFVGVLAVCFLPFVALSPGGVGRSLARQVGRPLQIETLGAGLLLAAHQAFGLGLTWRSGSGSQNLVGTLPDVLAVVQSVLQVAVIVGLWVRFARGRVDPARLVRYAAAVLVAFVALGKVLSPQFLIWLVPLVALVGGRRGMRAAVLLGAALVVTQGWFPFRYWDLVKHFDPVASWLVPVRDLLLVALLVELALDRGLTRVRLRAAAARRR